MSDGMARDSVAKRLSESVDKVSVGRVYDYMLGGTHNYAVDQAFAEEQLKHLPEMRDFARSNRAFLGRAVRYAAARGIRQFVDIGSGLPTQGNVHEVADQAAPGECRVVYIDNEPIAHAHAEILLEETADPERHHALDGDFFEGAALWKRVLGTGLIDPAEPICLLLVALLHFMPDEKRPDEVLAYYISRLPPGSLVALSHIHVPAGDEPAQTAGAKVIESYRRRTNHAAVLRDREEIARFFDGLEFAEPGLVWVPEWQPDVPYEGDPAQARGLAGVAWKR